MPAEHVRGIIDFFRGDFWNSFVTAHLRHPDEPVYHAHIYIDTSIHPDSMHPIMYAYWKSRGAPCDRAIDPQSPKAKVAALHGIHPAGYPPFDYFFRFNADAVIAPMPPELPEAEKGKNQLSWGKKYQDEFTSQFPYRVVGPEEDAVIRDYFTGKHWKETIAHVMDPSVMHCHANFYLNFDAKILEMYVRRELAKIGWRVEHAFPSVYDVRGEYTGKVIYLVGQPEKVFDTCWRFDPDVVLKNADDAWIFGKDEGFDNWYRPMYDEIIDGNLFYRLTESEIAEVIASFR